MGAGCGDGAGAVSAAVSMVGVGDAGTVAAVLEGRAGVLAEAGEHAERINTNKKHRLGKMPFACLEITGNCVMNAPVMSLERLPGQCAPFG